jgi:threonine/homoserine/homoserine lactone efflux protein
MAWTTVRGARGTAVSPVALPPASDRTLFRQGLLSSVLNPKVALFYLALLPQFIDPAQGSVLAQSLVLGVVQIAIAALVDGALVLIAAEVGKRFVRRPEWMRVQRIALGSVFGGLAVWLALSRRPG